MSGTYCIPVSGLKEGVQSFEFRIGKEFFGRIEESEVKEGDLAVIVEAEKHSSHAGLKIHISGKVMISCDRCLEYFAHPVECRNNLLIKFGKLFDDSDPDIITIPAGENELDMAQYFYEYIMLALPIQKVHPADKNGKSTCNPEMIKKIKAHTVNEDENKDPRWDELKKLIHNN